MAAALDDQIEKSAQFIKLCIKQRKTAENLIFESNSPVNNTAQELVEAFVYPFIYSDIRRLTKNLFFCDS